MILNPETATELLNSYGFDGSLKVIIYLFGISLSSNYFEESHKAITEQSQLTAPLKDRGWDVPIC